MVILYIYLPEIPLYQNFSLDAPLYMNSSRNCNVVNKDCITLSDNINFKQQQYGHNQSGCTGVVGSSYEHDSFCPSTPISRRGMKKYNDLSSLSGPYSQKFTHIGYNRQRHTPQSFPLTTRLATQ